MTCGKSQGTRSRGREKAQGQRLSDSHLRGPFFGKFQSVVVSRLRQLEIVNANLKKLLFERGAPHFLRSDNGPEFLSHVILTWRADSGILTAHIDPGKPWQNGDDERFKGKFRDACLSLEWFRSREEARVLIEVWRCHYNPVRPHSSLKDLTPIESKARYDSTTPGAIFN